MLNTNVLFDSWFINQSPIPMCWKQSVYNGWFLKILNWLMYVVGNDLIIFCLWYSLSIGLHWCLLPNPYLQVYFQTDALAGSKTTALYNHVVFSCLINRIATISSFIGTVGCFGAVLPLISFPVTVNLFSLLSLVLSGGTIEYRSWFTQKCCCWKNLFLLNDKISIVVVFGACLWNCA